MRRRTSSGHARGRDTLASREVCGRSDSSSTLVKREGDDRQLCGIAG